MSTPKKILLFLLLLVLAFLVWRYVSLKRAQIGSSQPITYRTFFGLGEKTPASSKPTYQSDFTNAPENTTPTEQGGAGGGTSANAPTSGAKSAFGNSAAISPLGSSSPSGQSSSIIGTSTNGNGSFDTSTNDNGNVTDNTPADGLQCDPRDITLEFTPEEQTRLNELQQELLQIAPNLRNADDVQTEINNYESYKLYNDKIVEYKNFCFAETAKFTTKPNRVPTPFWDDTSLDTTGFYTKNMGVKLGNGSGKPKSYYYTEHFFNMNIW